MAEKNEHDSNEMEPLHEHQQNGGGMGNPLND